MFNRNLKKELENTKKLYRATNIALNVCEDENDKLKEKIKEQDEKIKGLENNLIVVLDNASYYRQKIHDLENNLEFITNNLTPSKRAKIGR